MLSMNTCTCGGNCGGCGGYYALLGRILIAALFLIIGWGKITNFAGTVGFVASGGFPMPEFFTVLAIVFEFVGALLLIVGFHARVAAWMLIVFTAIATGAYHNVFADPTQQLMLLKNLSIIGGLLYVVAFGPGAWSLQKRCGIGICPDCKAAEKNA